MLAVSLDTQRANIYEILRLATAELARIPMRGYWDNRQARNEDAGVSSWT
jgi:hypothetical protein